MSYVTFEIKNNTVIIGKPNKSMKGIASTKNNALKELPAEVDISEIDSDIDLYLDSDNWDETPILDEIAESFGDMW